MEEKSKMLKISDLKDKQQYIKEVANLTQQEWGSKAKTKEEQQRKLMRKIEKIKQNFNHPYYCTLLLLNNEKLIGFISIFEKDCEERKELFPWYATMYVKKEYRGKGYSRILNDAILQEAKRRKIKRIYLKTTLENYYEKFGARYLETLDNGEKIYYFDLDGMIK